MRGYLKYLCGPQLRVVAFFGVMQFWTVVRSGICDRTSVTLSLQLGTCESFFLRSNRISNRIGRLIRFRIEFSNRIGHIYQRIFNSFHRYLFCICHEREWCTQLSTCYSFQFSPKTRQTMPLYDYITPKLDFKRKFNHRQSFLYKGRLMVRTIRKFWIGSSLRIESRISKLCRSLVTVYCRWRNAVYRICGFVYVLLFWTFFVDVAPFSINYEFRRSKFASHWRHIANVIHNCVLPNTARLKCVIFCKSLMMQM